MKVGEEISIKGVIVSYNHNGNEEDDSYEAWYTILTEEGHLIKVPSYFDERI